MKALIGIGVAAIVAFTINKFVDINIDVKIKKKTNNEEPEEEDPCCCID